MTIHEPRTGTARMVGRFVWHYVEMVIAMSLGMLLLGLVWSAVLPPDTRFDVDTLIMAADMAIGMGGWMRIRRHSWPSTAEMSLAMVLPFPMLLVPYWFGVLPDHLVMTIGHVLMFVVMALIMVRRRAEYRHRIGVRPTGVRRAAVVLVVLLAPATFSAVNTIDTFDTGYRARPAGVTDPGMV